MVGPSSCTVRLSLSNCCRYSGVLRSGLSAGLVDGLPDDEAGGVLPLGRLGDVDGPVDMMSLLINDAPPGEFDIDIVVVGGTKGANVALSGKLILLLLFK